MQSLKPQVTKEGDVWVIRLSKTDGRIQEYRCSTEAQARQLAAMLLPKPEAEAKMS